MDGLLVITIVKLVMLLILHGPVRSQASRDEDPGFCTRIAQPSSSRKCPNPPSAESLDLSTLIGSTARYKIRNELGMACTRANISVSNFNLGGGHSIPNEGSGPKYNRDLTIDVSTSAVPLTTLDHHSQLLALSQNSGSADSVDQLLHTLRAAVGNGIGEARVFPINNLTYVVDMVDGVASHMQSEMPSPTTSSASASASVLGILREASSYLSQGIESITNKVTVIEGLLNNIEGPLAYLVSAGTHNNNIGNDTNLATNNGNVSRVVLTSGLCSARPMIVMGELDPLSTTPYPHDYLCQTHITNQF